MTGVIVRETGRLTINHTWVENLEEWLTHYPSGAVWKKVVQTDEDEQPVLLIGKWDIVKWNDKPVAAVAYLLYESGESVYHIVDDVICAVKVIAINN